MKAEQILRSTCPYCGVGCQVLLYVKDDRIFRVDAPFAEDPKLPRTTLDRKVTLDLATPSQFAMEVKPSAVSGEHVSLYFRSGAGWYAGGATLHGTDWHQHHRQCQNHWAGGVLCEQSACHHDPEHRHPYRQLGVQRLRQPH